MSISGSKSINAIHDGQKIKGIYRREVGAFKVKKGAVTITAPEYEYSFDFTVGGKRFRSVFGKESKNGKIGATGKWESCAIEKAVEALVRFRENAKTGEGPTSTKEDQDMAREANNKKKEEKLKEKSVTELAEQFLGNIAIGGEKTKALKPRTIEEYRLNLYRDVIPAIGNRKAKDIMREDISDIIDKIAARGKFIQANRTLAACSRLFSWAFLKGRVLYNPCTKMERYEERPRKRVLTEPEKKEINLDKPRHEEIKLLWQQLTARQGQPEARILLLCLLIGSRPGEVCKMRWEEIEEDNWWTVSNDKIKTDVELVCYLSPTALGILGKKRKNGFVFPMEADKDRQNPVDRLSKYVRVQNDYFGLPPWQPRDLRRTFTTLATGLGFSDLIINKAQARKDSTVIRTHYDMRRYYDELRQLFGAIEHEVLRIIGQPMEPAKVIPLRS